MIKGKKCTITQYVDDNKTSHVDESVVTEILEAIRVHFGDLVIYRGNGHNLLGIKVSIDRKEKVIPIDMEDQLMDALEIFGEKVDDTVSV